MDSTGAVERTIHFSEANTKPVEPANFMVGWKRMGSDAQNLCLHENHGFPCDPARIDVCGLLGPTLSRGRPAW